MERRRKPAALSKGSGLDFLPKPAEQRLRFGPSDSDYTPTPRGWFARFRLVSPIRWEK